MVAAVSGSGSASGNGSGSGAGNALAVVRDAALARLRAEVAVTRVFEGAGARGTVPFLTLRELSAGDWGTKDAAGREVRVGIAVRDEGDSGARAQALAASAEAALLALPRAIAGWRIVTVAPVRNAVLGEGAGRWVALVDVRVRMMEEK